MLDQHAGELRRLFGLTDVWLGAELLRIARGVRSRDPRSFSAPVGGGEWSDLVWHLAPEVARRLGSRSLLPNEACLVKLRDEDGLSLRKRIGASIEFITRRRDDPGLDLLTRSACRGNPVCIGLDRVAPPGDAVDRSDHIAYNVVRASRQSGHGDRNVWFPDIGVAAVPETLPFRRP